MKPVSLLLAAAAVAAFSLTGAAWAQDSYNQGPAPASDAQGQLDNATSGTQSTGQTFDGGNTPTDAYPDGTSGDSSSGSDNSSSGDPN